MTTTAQSNGSGYGNAAVKMLSSWRRNHVLAIKEILHISLWWAQRLIVRAAQDRKFVIVNGCRGMGKTYLMALIAVIHALLYPKTRVLIVSASYRQAKLAFAQIRILYDNCPLFAQACVKKPTIAMDECYVELRNGARITALPTGSGDKIRGQRAHLILADEWVQIPLDLLEQVVLPMMNVHRDPMGEVDYWKREMEARKQGKTIPRASQSNNRIILFSTGWWKFSPHYDYWVRFQEAEKSGDPRYKNIHVSYRDIPTFSECLKCKQITEGYADNCSQCGSSEIKRHGFLDMDQIEMQQRVMSDAVWAMETLAAWMPDTAGFYRMSSIYRCTSGVGQALEFAPEFKGEPGAQYVLGVDPAREQDRFALVVVKIAPKNDQVVYCQAFSKEDYVGKNATGSMANLIRDLHRRFGFSRICIDAGGGGLQIRDLLEEDFVDADPDTGETIKYPALVEMDSHLPGEHIVEMVNFSSEWINTVAYDVLSKLDTQRIWFPAIPRDGDDALEMIYEEIKELKNEMSNIIAEPLPHKGHMRFKTASKSAKKDRVSALWMATWGARQIRTAMGPQAELPTMGLAASTVLNCGITAKRQEAVNTRGELVPMAGSVLQTENPVLGSVGFNPGAAALGARRFPVAKKRSK